MAQGSPRLHRYLVPLGSEEVPPYIPGCRGLIVSIYQYPIHLIALHHRWGTFHGPQDAQNAPDSFLQSVKQGRTPTIFGSLDCVSVANVAAKSTR